MDSGNHASIIAGAEFMLALVLGAFAAGCVAQWLREWRHEPQGRVFFTLFTGGAVVMVLGLLADALYNMRML